MDRKDNIFVLFKNNKSKPSQPDLKGEGLYKGEKISLALWTQIAKSGTEYFSGKFSEIVGPEPSTAPQQTQEKNDLLTRGMVKPETTNKPIDEPFLDDELPW